MNLDRELKYDRQAMQQVMERFARARWLNKSMVSPEGWYLELTDLGHSKIRPFAEIFRPFLRTADARKFNVLERLKVNVRLGVKWGLIIADLHPPFRWSRAEKAAFVVLAILYAKQLEAGNIP